MPIYKPNFLNNHTPRIVAQPRHRQNWRHFNNPFTIVGFTYFYDFILAAIPKWQHGQNIRNEHKTHTLTRIVQKGGDCLAPLFSFHLWPTPSAGFTIPTSVPKCRLHFFWVRVYSMSSTEKNKLCINIFNYVIRYLVNHEIRTTMQHIVQHNIVEKSQSRPMLICAIHIWWLFFSVTTLFSWSSKAVRFGARNALQLTTCDCYYCAVAAIMVLNEVIWKLAFAAAAASAAWFTKHKPTYISTYIEFIRMPQSSSMLSCATLLLNCSAQLCISNKLHTHTHEPSA